ncbi:MAG: hypothetical protein ACOWWM_09825 [Desulfobacterales bacterium]
MGFNISFTSKGPIEIIVTPAKAGVSYITVTLSRTEPLANAQFNVLALCAGLNDRDEAPQGWIPFGAQHADNSRFLLFELRGYFVHRSGSIDIIADHQTTGRDLPMQNHVKRFRYKGPSERGILLRPGNDQFFELS